MGRKSKQQGNVFIWIAVVVAIMVAIVEFYEVDSPNSKKNMERAKMAELQNRVSALELAVTDMERKLNSLDHK
jgi:uncharacterized protein YceH (UPF0502 family)